MKKLFAFIFLLGLAIPARADTITLVADEWCPYNCAVGAEHEGILVDLARLIFEPMGHQVVYQTMPWTRAIEEARLGRFNGVVGAARDEVPDFVYPAFPAVNSRIGFYVLPSSPWKYKGVESLGSVSVAVIQDYLYSAEIDQYIKDNYHNFAQVQVVTGDEALSQNIRKLLAGRVDVLIEDTAVMAHYMNEHQLDGQIVSAGATEPEGLYIAFSPMSNESLNYAKIFENGLSDMRRTGRFNMLLKLYGINPDQK